MKSMIITVAGTATRFNRDTNNETLKCLYYKGDPKNSLLYQILSRGHDHDEIIIIGGYLYDKLVDFIDTYLGMLRSRIKIVYNPHYRDYGSGYSLILGIDSLDSASTETLFIEGDLYVDYESFRRISQSDRDVISVSPEPIRANKAVALYVDETDHVHYIYDTSHQSLYIPEPFTAIYNSGQAWKFFDVHRLHSVVDALSPAQRMGTNLEIIQCYFGHIEMRKIEVVRFETWHNCNTVYDYEKVYTKLLAQV